MKPLGDFLVARVHPQGHVGREHHRGMRPLRVVGIGHGALGRGVFRRPLPGAGRALRELPFVAEEVFKVAVGPLRGRGRPRPLQAAGDRVIGIALAEAVLPAQALLDDVSTLRRRADVIRAGGAVRFSEGVAAGDQGHRFFVVHRHAAERLSNIPGRGERIGLAVGSLRIDVDQAHLDGGQRVFELPITAVAIVAEPLALRSPGNVLLRLPDVGTPAGKPECFEAHRLQRDVAGKHHQVGPGDLVAVLLLDRPEEPPRLVEVGVVGPAVERGKPLGAVARAPPAVADPVGARAVPCHPNEERTVVPVVGWPPGLRRGQEFPQVLLQGIQVERLKRRGVVEVAAHRTHAGGVLMQDLEVELIRPPVGV